MVAKNQLVSEKPAGGLTGPPLSPRKPPGNVLHLIAGGLVICALVFLVYRPLLPGSFLMDDHRLIAEDNPLVNGEFTLGNIWFQTDFILSNIAFWVQWLAWGDHPGNYHAVNMALHAVSAILLWRVLARLPMPGAWVAAALFAVHPVTVNSVARIAELKNTLSLPFFLLSLWAFLRSEDHDSANRRSAALPPQPEDYFRAAPDKPAGDSHFPAAAKVWLWYGFSLAAFVLALLAKTSAVMLSPLLLLVIHWRRGKLAPGDEWRLGPYFLLSLVFGVMSAGFQKYQALGDHPLPPESLGERLVIAGKIIWFYLGKDFWPVNLNAFYPLWKVNAANPAAYLPLALLGVIFILGCRFRQSWGRPFLLGLGGFVILLFPVLGFFAGQYQTWFQVSDHLQYLPMIAPVALGTAALAWLLGKNYFPIAAAGLIACLAILSFHRAQVFSHEESLMRDCLAKNPAAWGAQTTLGTVLARQKDYAGAIACFKTALTYAPADEAANLDLGHALTLQGDFTQAEPCLLQAIKTKPLDPEAHRQYAEMLARQGRVPEAIRRLQIALTLKSDPETRLRYAALLFQTGAVRPAEEQLRQVVQAKPNTPEALNNLAWLLATSADEQLRNGPEAVRYAEKACALTGYKQAGLVGTLAAAYAEAGRFPEAVKNCQLTIELANAAGQGGFAAVNQQLLALYQSGRPYHTAPSPGQ